MPSWVRIVLALLGAWQALTAAPALARMSDPIAVCIAPVRDGDTAAAMLRATRYDCTTKQTDLGAGDYWVRSRALNDLAETIRFGSAWQDRVTLYALYADGALYRATMDGPGITRRLQLGAAVAQRLPERAAPLVRLLWRVDGAINLRGVVVGVRLASIADETRSNLLLGALYAAFGGLCLALIVYNFALWVALRHGFQLAYCAMIVALAGYALTTSGALAWLVPTVANTDRIRLNYVLLAVSGAAALAFARYFFEPRVIDRGLQRCAVAVIVLLIGSALAFVAAVPHFAWWLDRLYAVSFLALLGLAMVILVRAWRRRSSYLWLFALAWAVPIAVAALRVAINFHLLRWNFLTDNSTLIAMTIEALVSSAAIAYRIRVLSQERDEAREQEVAARMLADLDPLTGLMNRRAFLRETIGRGGKHLLLLADIDHFKRVNETLGHDGGDEVLRIVARGLRASAPPDALIARIGGEEFAILIQGDDAAKARAILDHIRAMRMPFDLSVTVSIGTAAGGLATETDWIAQYRRADRALFDAKAAGRDNVRHAA